MNENIFEKIKLSVNITDVAERFGVKLDRNGKGLCPFHREDTPSFSVKKDDNIFKCFGCGEGGDVIDFVSKFKGVEPLEAAKIIATDFGITIDEPKESKPKKLDIKKYITGCIKDISKTNYFQKRGLTDETVKRFSLGFDEFRQTVIIPYSSKLNYYQSRSIMEKKFFKPKTEDAGPEPIYNAEALFSSSAEPVFVVESPICAMSIIQCGGQALALCGTGLNKLISEIKKKKFNKTLIICLDNDEPGQKASQELANLLFENNIKFDAANIAGDCKDPNELLMQDSQKLIENITIAKKAAKLKYITEKDSISAAELQKMGLNSPNWIIKDMLPEGLGIICAPSKAGKSWMMLQMCLAITTGDEFLNLRTNKHACLYYALEDSKYRLKDRMSKILKGKTAPDNLYFSVKADTIDNGLYRQIKGELEQNPDIKLVVVDTLQKVRGKTNRNETAYSSDYREMADLKDFADKNKICLLFVHHLRKMSDADDVFNMISGSTGIMAACDTIFIISKKKRGDDMAKLSMTGRDIKQKELMVHFNLDTYQWEVAGTAEEIEKKQHKSAYLNNPVIITIKQLLKNTPGGWKGTASDLLKACYDVTNEPVAESPTGIGKLIQSYEQYLYEDGISHSMKKSGNTRAHIFFPAKYRIGWQEKLV